jgi:hypothetical protein
MSYCRWSSDNWRCDVYCYASVSGAWTTHVAGRRRWPIVPPTFPWRFNSNKIGSWFFWLSYRLQMWSLSFIPLRAIGLKHDGETFEDDGPWEMAQTLEMLRREGYNVPQYAIDNLREEATELANNTGEKS